MVQIKSVKFQKTVIMEYISDEGKIIMNKKHDNEFKEDTSTYYFKQLSSLNFRFGR